MYTVRHVHEPVPLLIHATRNTYVACITLLPITCKGLLLVNAFILSKHSLPKIRPLPLRALHEVNTSNGDPLRTSFIVVTGFLTAILNKHVSRT